MNAPLQVLLFALCAIRPSAETAAGPPEPPRPARGVYFAKKSYNPAPLPQFAELRNQLPSPMLAERPEWISMYWKAWELAAKNFHEPAPGSGYVSQFIDAAFNQNIFQWDTCFMTMFCNYGHPLVPGIGSLDNFYAKQHEDGEICREIDRAAGLDYAPWVNQEGKPLFSRWGWVGVPNAPVLYRHRRAPEPPPRLTLDALNHPIFAWAELESYQLTGDRARLERVYPPLVHYYRALQKYLRQGNGLYMTDWASMDNSPRNAFLNGGGTAIDTSSQMVLYARNLATIAERIGQSRDGPAFLREAADLSRQINQLMWDPREHFYFDLAQTGKRAQVKTIAAFWTLLAGVASPEQARDLAGELAQPRTFQRRHRVPTLAADQPGYDAAGGYWRGAVWAPTTLMVVRGLERYGQSGLAREIALNHLGLMGEVFQKTGTIWENYAPDSPAPGQPAKPDFVGWSGLGPILCLLEFAIGLKPEAGTNQLDWELNSVQAAGCDRFRFNGHVVSLRAEALAKDAPGRPVSIQSDGAFQLVIRQGQRVATYAVTPGAKTIEWPGPQR